MWLSNRFRQVRSNWRISRLLWPEPNEVRLMELMGGWVLRIRWLRHPQSSHSLAVAWSVGPYLRHHGIKRAVKVGSGENVMFLDFATYENGQKKAIEVLSNNWHNSILEDEVHRRELQALGWETLFLESMYIKYYPEQAKEKIVKFLGR